MLVQLLLPLCGNEEFDIDVRLVLPRINRFELTRLPTQVLDELPAELQLLPSDKTRESDPQIRTILVETLVLLATNRSNREAMRKRGVYPVIKEAHSKEAVPAVKEAMVRLVNLLMRDEGPETALEEVDAQTDPADLPPAPSFENNSNFVQHQEAPAEEAKGEEEVKEVVEQREAQEEKEDERPQHHNVPLSRMQVRTPPLHRPSARLTGLSFNSRRRTRRRCCSRSEDGSLGKPRHADIATFASHRLLRAL